MSGPPASSRSLTMGLTKVIIALAAISLAAVLTACGGGEDEPSVHLLLEADLSELPPEADQDGVMTILVNVLGLRAQAFGDLDVDIEREDSSRVSVTLRGVISQEEVRQLMEKRALLELRQPVLDDNGDIICESPDAARFSVSTEDISYTPEAPDGRPAPRCLGSEGQSGQIVWEPAVDTDGQDSTQDVPPVTVRTLSAWVDRTREPVVLAKLTVVDALLLQVTSERLVGFPLGFFLDGELLAGPTIQESLTGGMVPIAGLSLNDANILAAQFNAGSLPVPVREISIEGTSE